MTSAADLYALQEIDLRRDHHRAIVADVDARLGESDEIYEARETVEDSLSALERLRKRQREADAQLQDLDAKIRPVETRLYDGSVRNPKELTDLQRELDSFKDRRTKLDEQGITLLDGVEAASRALDQARADLARLEAEWAADQDHLRATRAKAESELDTLNGQRGQRTKGMDPLPLGLYEQLRNTKQGRAVSRVERGICQGCHVSLPTHLSQRLRVGRELVQCPRCERILVAG
jgi:predicted  nucleic acid-binding Zn-ribbon protein